MALQNSQGRGEKMKGRVKEKKRARKIVTLSLGRIEVPFGSALLCQLP